MDFENIFLGFSQVPGKLRLAPNGLGWKANEGNDKPTTVASDNIKYAEWTRVARQFQLKLILARGERKSLSFDGFKREDYDRITNLMKNNYDVTIDSKETSVRGWNWGKAELHSNDLSFMVAGKPAFTVPVAAVHNTAINKTEITLEFLPPTADVESSGKKSRYPVADELVEMRLFIPGSEANARKRAKKAAKEAQTEDGAKKESGDEENEDEEMSEADADGAEQAAAQVFHDAIKEKAEIGLVTGDALVTFAEVHCVTPRGKYDCELYNGFLRLRNKSYDYKILYSSIKRLFILPRNDEVNVQFVINLDPPIRQGQTRYPYLVMQFAKEEVMEAELNLDDDEIKTTYPELRSKYESGAVEVVSDIFRAISGKKTIAPSTSFQSNDNQSSIKCNLRASEGHLYMLDKFLLFISKVPLLISYNDVGVVHFERVSSAMSASRTIDVRLEMRTDGADITFTSINKEEHPHLSEFLADKKIKVKNQIQEEMVGTQQAVAAALLEESSGDESMSDRSVDSNPKKSKSKDPRAMDVDDEDSEVDEDFKAESDSDVAEEYDENYSSAGSDAEAEAPKRKKKKDASEGDSPPKKKSKKSKDD